LVDVPMQIVQGLRREEIIGADYAITFAHDGPKFESQ